MLLAGTDNIRDVVPFPMNQKAQDVMMGAPAPVTPEHYQYVLRLTGYAAARDDALYAEACALVPVMQTIPSPFERRLDAQLIAQKAEKWLNKAEKELNK